MNATRKEFIDHVFVLDENEIRKLVDAILVFAPLRNLSVKCADNLERKLKNIDELLEFENSASKEITSLSLSAMTDNFDRTARIEFENKKGSNVYLSIEGPEEAVLALSSDFQDRLASTKPWYAFFAQRDALNIVAAFLGLSFIGLVFFVAFNLLTGRWKSEGSNPNDPKATILGSVTTLAIFLAAGIAVFVLNRTQKALFPVGVFSIGQGKKRYERKEWWRTSVVVAFFVSIAAGIVLLLITLAIR